MATPAATFFILLSGILASAPGVLADPADRNQTHYGLKDTDPEAVCLNGGEAGVTAYAGSKDPTKWVIMLGPDSPGIGFCINPADCALIAKPPASPAPPPPPPAPMATTWSGPLSANCSSNPDFCDANVAYITICTMDLLIGDNVYDANGTTLHFKGTKVLAASIKKLATLGLQKAEKVLLTGNGGHGGTMVFLHADRIRGMLKSLAPSLKVYKAMPVDGFHPKLVHTLLEQVLPVAQRSGYTWYWDAIKMIVNMSNGAAALKESAPGCAKANPGSEHLCLYVNNSLADIATPLFAVQQMNSVWDTQCINDGEPWGGMLQVTCSLENHFYAMPYVCGQYTDLCPPETIKSWWAPSQQQYITDYTRSGTHSKPGNGGFFHSCYLGAYINSDFGSTNETQFPRAQNGVWNEITVGGKTMQQAVGEWWNADASAPAPFLQDTVWDADGKPPTTEEWRAPHSNLSTGLGKTPIVPWYTNKYMTNPTCRGYPWY